ncbi:MAG: hypothetical protein QM775_13200 [Pirellulales bacterium]
MVEAYGADRVIVNPVGAMTGTLNINSITYFAGRYSLTFANTASTVDINSDGSLRNRTFQFNNTTGVTTLNFNMSSSGGEGTNFLKTGSGTLVLGGTNTQINKLTSNGNYATSLFIDAGIVRVSADANLGSTSYSATTGQQYNIANAPSQVRIRSGTTAAAASYLQISSGFTTARQFLLASNGTAGTVFSGFDVMAGQTLTLTGELRDINLAAQVSNLIKTGSGTLILNNTGTAAIVASPVAATNYASSFDNLIIGGQPQNNVTLNGVQNGRGVGGGIVSTTVNTTGATPLGLATGAITINGGTLQLNNVGGGATNMAHATATLNYGAAHNFNSSSPAVRVRLSSLPEL